MPTSGFPLRNRVCIVLDEVTDPHNFGAILRSAYFFGISRVIQKKKNSCPVTPAVSKVSAGAVEFMDTYTVKYMDDFLWAATEQDGWRVVLAHVDQRNEIAERIDTYNHP